MAVIELTTYTEYISRKGRSQLVKLYIKEVSEDIAKEREQKKKRGEKLGRGKPDIWGSASHLLGLTKQGLRNLVNENYHASNVTTQTLIEKCGEYNPSRTLEIIENDLENSKQEIEKKIKEIRDKA